MLLSTENMVAAIVKRHGQNNTALGNALSIFIRPKQTKDPITFTVTFP